MSTTDIIPPAGMTSTGYRSTFGLLLSACCAHCQVWITPDCLEFDGFPHRCPDSKQRPSDTSGQFDMLSEARA